MQLFLTIRQILLLIQQIFTNPKPQSVLRNQQIRNNNPLEIQRLTRFVSRNPATKNEILFARNSHCTDTFIIPYRQKPPKLYQTNQRDSVIWQTHRKNQRLKINKKHSNFTVNLFSFQIALFPFKMTNL